MAYQASLANTNFPLILAGEGMIKDNETILTDGSRTVPLYQGTIMAQVASSRKWVPWLNANLGGTTGTQYPWGILVSDTITAATYAAGDVTGVQILVGGAGCQIDASLLVFDKGTTGVGTPNDLTVIPTVPTNLALTAESILNMKGLFPTQTVAGDNLEN